MSGELRARALLELFAECDTVFDGDERVFAINHECPASIALGRIYRAWGKARPAMELEAEVFGQGRGPQ